MIHRNNSNTLHALNQGDCMDRIWNRLYYSKLLVLSCHDKKSKIKGNCDFVEIIKKIGGVIKYERCEKKWLFIYGTKIWGRGYTV